MAHAPIEVHDLTVAYDGKVALKDIDHVFPTATSTAIMGANGSGKTTLLNAVADLVTPLTGSVTGPESGRVGYVMQDGHRRWMPITVSEIMQMGRYQKTGLLRRLTSADRKLIDEAIEQLEIGDLQQRQFHDLSGGQRQRVRVAQALVSRPTVLLLDEPITGLDLASQQRILEVIADETSSGTTVIITTHHLDEARHCDQVLLLATTVVAAGTPDDVLQPETLKLAFGGRTLGHHDDHDHPHEMLILDDHGHGDHHQPPDQHMASPTRRTGSPDGH